jgi:hypothetical protein
MKFLRNIRNMLLGFVVTHKLPKPDCIKLGSRYGSKKFVKPNKQVKWLISGGVGEDISFDIEFYNLYQSKLILIDPTLKSKSHINDIFENLGKSPTSKYSKTGKQPVGSYDLSKINSENLIFINKALYSDELKEVVLFAPIKEDHVSYSVLQPDKYAFSRHLLRSEVVSINTLIKDFLLVDEYCIVKLDIEGSEYEVIKSMFKNSFFPQQILVEIDELYVNFWKNYKLSRNIINFMLQNNYEYMTNDHGYDFCFVRK